MSENDNTLPEGSVPLAESLAMGANTAPIGKVVYQPAQAVVIALSDGRKVGMARPKMSLSSLLAGVLANIEYKAPGIFEVERSRVKSLLYITDIDGVAEPKIADPIMRAALEQKLGDEYLDAIFIAWAENFPSADATVLKATKKF